MTSSHQTTKFFTAMAAALLCTGVTHSTYGQTSGMLIGVNVVEQPTGLRVVNLIPGTPAVGKFLPGDVLRFITAPGKPVYSAHMRSHLEKAKTALGMGSTAVLQIERPGQGTKYFSVTFVPVGGTIPGGNFGPASVETLGIQDIPPPSVPAVAQMFNGPATPGGPGVPPIPPGVPGLGTAPPTQPGSNASLEDLFK